MQQQTSQPAALTKINLVSLHTAAFQDGYQAGKYHQMYRDQIKDIASEQTARLPVPVRPVHNTDKYDLRILALPITLDTLIKNLQKLHRAPAEIKVHPKTFEVLRQASFIFNNRYRGLIAITADKAVDEVSIQVDSYNFTM